MIKLGKIIKEIMDAIPPNNVQQAQSNVISSDFVNHIKMVENGQKVGYDKIKNLWFPHKSVEGGFPTIGYGHKIQSSSELNSMNKGITDKDVENLLKSDLSIANKHVHDYIKNRYKVDILLTEMLTDFVFNLGGLKKFPKFVDAVLRNKWDVVKHQYIRNSSGKELKGRNKAFYDRFLK